MEYFQVGGGVVQQNGIFYSFNSSTESQLFDMGKYSELLRSVLFLDVGLDSL